LYAQFFRHRITIDGVVHPSASSGSEEAEFAANGGINRYSLCVFDPTAIQQVNNKAPISIDFGFRYRGEFGPTQSMCLVDAKWDYEFNDIAGNVEPCKNSPKEAKYFTNAVMFWAAIIFGSLVFSYPVALFMVWYYEDVRRREE
jgi:hypothetical protein